jgi:hypothetical protein
LPGRESHASRPDRALVARLGVERRQQRVHVDANRLRAELGQQPQLPQHAAAEIGHLPATHARHTMLAQDLERAHVGKRRAVAGVVVERLVQRAQHEPRPHAVGQCRRLACGPRARARRIPVHGARLDMRQPRHGAEEVARERRVHERCERAGLLPQLLHA